MQPRANDKTIMVIDDIFEGEYLYTSLIAKVGYQVAFYDDPVLALAAVERVRPVLAVSDVCMPHMDGYTLLERIRRVFPAMPFLMVSATPENLVRAGGIENCRALAKPFENGNFRDMVRSFLIGFDDHEKGKAKHVSLVAAVEPLLTSLKRDPNGFRSHHHGHKSSHKRALIEPTAVNRSDRPE